MTSVRFVMIYLFTFIKTENFPAGSFCKILSFVRSMRLPIYSEFYIFFQYVLCIPDCSILICKLCNKFLIFMPFLILIISYILIFKWNFELIFLFMALKRAPICGRNVCLTFYVFFFLYLPLIIFNMKIKRIWPNAKITKLIKILWMLGQYDSRHVFKHVTLHL